MQQAIVLRWRGVDHLREELLRIESLGGEDLMLRESGSLPMPPKDASGLSSRVTESMPV